MNKKYGKIRSVTICMPEVIWEEIDERRGFDSKSKYILKVIDTYHRNEDDQQQKDKLLGAPLEGKHQSSRNN